MNIHALARVERQLAIMEVLSNPLKAILWPLVFKYQRHLQNPANSGGAASSLPTIRRRMGNEDVAPPWFCKSLSEF